MMIFDMFFYLAYRFGTKILKRDVVDSGFSALVTLATYLGFASVTTLCIIGLLTKDDTINFWIMSIVESKPYIFSILAGFVGYIIFWFRYFRMMNIENEDIVKKIRSLTNVQRKLYKILVIFVMLAVPICSFVFYRLYILGYVRWW